jgi:hypothetical protein
VEQKGTEYRQSFEKLQIAGEAHGVETHKEEEEEEEEK